jgi:hypothetical protein
VAIRLLSSSQVACQRRRHDARPNTSRISSPQEVSIIQRRIIDVGVLDSTVEIGKRRERSRRVSMGCFFIYSDAMSSCFPECKCRKNLMVARKTARVAVPDFL